MTKKSGVRWFGAAVAAIALGAAGVWLLEAVGADSRKPDAKSQGEPDAERPVGVRLSRLESTEIDDRFRAVGSIVARDRLMLAAERAGRVTEVLVRDGARVESGEEMIRFEDDAERADEAAARAALDEKRLEAERAQTLAAQDVLSEAVLEDRRAALASARARLAAAQTALADRLLKAPFAGRIGRIEVSPGDFVKPGQPLVELTTTDQPRARFAVPAEVAVRARTGQSVGVHLDEDDAPLPATLVLVERTARAADRLVEIEAVVEGGTRRLMPGRFVEVDVPLSSGASALLAPQSAIQWAGPQAFVFVVDEDGRARRTAVTTGARRGAQIVVEGEGLAEGREIVSLGLQKIRDGDRVEALGPDGGRGR